MREDSSWYPYGQEPRGRNPYYRFLVWVNRSTLSKRLSRFLWLIVIGGFVQAKKGKKWLKKIWVCLSSNSLLIPDRGVCVCCVCGVCVCVCSVWCMVRGMCVCVCAWCVVRVSRARLRFSGFQVFNRIPMVKEILVENNIPLANAP